MTTPRSLTVFTNHCKQKILQHMGKQKTIGLIGGMSWESSKVYYELLNKKINAMLGGSHSCQCVMVSVDYSEIEKLSFANNWERIGEIMVDWAQRLEATGADCFLITSNPIHEVADTIVKHVNIPFIHIAEVTGQAILRDGHKKVGLMGTRYTMERDFYKSILEDKFGIEVVIPSENDRKALHNMIYNELVKGQFSESAKTKCLAIIQNLQDAGAEGAILGCTELPILMQDSEVAFPTYDTTTLHAHAAAAWSVGTGQH